MCDNYLTSREWHGNHYCNNAVVTVETGKDSENGVVRPR